jgi:hypothetical protein
VARESGAANETGGLTAVQNVVSRYQSALEARDIRALKRIWPGLSGRQEEAIRTEFEHARAIDVAVNGLNVKMNGAAAVASGRRNYQVTTADGRTLRTATQMTITLSRRDNGWVIDDIRHERVP